MFILPVLSVLINFWIDRQLFRWALIGKWFVFWSIGARLFIAGLRQIFNPAFTAENIFHIEDKESYAIVKELGFANVCLGTISIVSLFVPEWRTAAAFAGGLFFGLAGANHLIKKPASSNEVIAMISDIFIFLVMLIYLLVRLSDK